MSFLKAKIEDLMRLLVVKTHSRQLAFDFDQEIKTVQIPPRFKFRTLKGGKGNGEKGK